MSDRLHDIIIGVFNEGFARDQAEANAVRTEIKQRGTYWAGGEIWQLRKTVASLRKRLVAAEAVKS